MRELRILGLTAALLALIALSVFALGDRTIFVSPPEAVAEGMIRQLAGQRVEQARALMSDRARETYTARRLSAWFRDVESVADPIQDIDGTDPQIADQEAWATVAVKGGHRSFGVRLSMIRERGLWRVDELPDPDEFAP